MGISEGTEYLRYQVPCHRVILSTRVVKASVGAIQPAALNVHIYHVMLTASKRNTLLWEKWTQKKVEYDSKNYLRAESEQTSKSNYATRKDI